MIDLTHFSEFTGVAGFDIAAERAGFRTIGQVEKADWPFRGPGKTFSARAALEGY
jgi:DNA (cytosine-5)-methyltransferase 1